MRSRLPLPQDQQRRRPKNKHEEKQLIAHDGPNQRHLLLARRQPARLTEFVQPDQRQLKRHQHQDRAGNRKKSVQRNAQRALKEKHTHSHCRGNAQDGPDPGLQTFRGHLHRA